MLVLSRKAAETIVIDHRIQVTILKARRGVVRLGIQAPRDIPVVRAELGRCDSAVPAGGSVANELSVTSGHRMT